MDSAEESEIQNWRILPKWNMWCFTYLYIDSVAPLTLQRWIVLIVKWVNLSTCISLKLKTAYLEFNSDKNMITLRVYTMHKTISANQFLVKSELMWIYKMLIGPLTYAFCEICIGKIDKCLPFMEVHPIYVINTFNGSPSNDDSSGPKLWVKYHLAQLPKT